MTNLKLIRNFRNYLIELKNSGNLSSKEIEIIRYNYGNIFNKLIEGTNNKNINNCTLQKSDIIVILANINNVLNETSESAKLLKIDLDKLHNELFN